PHEEIRARDDVQRLAVPDLSQDPDALVDAGRSELTQEALLIAPGSVDPRLQPRMALGERGHACDEELRAVDRRGMVREDEARAPSGSVRPALPVRASDMNTAGEERGPDRDAGGGHAGAVQGLRNP